MFFFFFFQAEDGIRDLTVTGVQTCALPISHHGSTLWHGDGWESSEKTRHMRIHLIRFMMMATHPASRPPPRSEEHTSELQSQSNLVCRLLLEKKKNSDRAHCEKTRQHKPLER